MDAFAFPPLLSTIVVSSSNPNRIGTARPCFIPAACPTIPLLSAASSTRASHATARLAASAGRRHNKPTSVLHAHAQHTHVHEARPHDTSEPYTHDSAAAAWYEHTYNGAHIYNGRSYLPGSLRVTSVRPMHIRCHAHDAAAQRFPPGCLARAAASRRTVGIHALRRACLTAERTGRAGRRHRRPRPHRRRPRPGCSLCTIRAGPLW